MANLSLLLPIIAALITIIGPLTPYIIDKILLYNPYKPIIEFDPSIYHFGIRNEINLEIKNNGGGSATNMTLFISTPNIISNLTNIMTTGDLLYNKSSIDIGEEIEVNNSEIKLQLPIFVQGEGSIISLKFSLDFEPGEGISEYAEVKIRAIYDQGSSEAIYDQGSGELKDYSIIGIIHNFLNLPYRFLGMPISLFLLTYGFLIPIYSVFFWYLHTKKKRKKYFNQIVKNLLSIRRMLELNIDTHEIFDFWDETTLWLSISGKREEIKPIEKKKNILKNFLIGNNKKWLKKELERYRKRLNVKDYVVLDNFQVLLEKRNNLLNTNIENENFPVIKLRELNKEISQSANELLTKIDWNKYR